jgi:acetyltransferase-like isoleucine patch superfamily enzyme
MDNFRKGGFFYGLLYLLWRGSLSAQGFLLSKIYSRALRKCGKNTEFQSGVYIGYPKNVQVGNNCFIGRGVVFTSELPTGKLLIGDGVQISEKVGIDFSGTVVIKNNTLLSSNVTILSHSHGFDPRSNPSTHELTIDENAWVGRNALILPGVTKVGKGAIIGAGAVVTKSVPDNVIVAGNPAKVIKPRPLVTDEC